MRLRVAIRGFLVGSYLQLVLAGLVLRAGVEKVDGENLSGRVSGWSSWRYPVSLALHGRWRCAEPAVVCWRRPSSLHARCVPSSYATYHIGGFLISIGDIGCVVDRFRWCRRWTGIVREPWCGVAASRLEFCRANAKISANLPSQSSRSRSGSRTWASAARVTCLRAADRPWAACGRWEAALTTGVRSIELAEAQGLRDSVRFTT